MSPERTTNRTGATSSGDPLAGLSVEFVRSPRRRKTVSARLHGNRLVVQVPAGLSAEEERSWAARLGGQILKTRRHAALNDDQALLRRAQELNHRYFGGRLNVTDVRYVTNQRGRFGSCTTTRGTIRISDRVAAMPAWVRDAVLVHELAHLVEPNHSASFWALANAYPLMERARGYLIAIGLEPDTS